MSQNAPVQIGSVCVSKAGRDKGRFLAVVEILGGEFVAVADGSLRKLASPKKKKLKHLHIKPVVLTTIAEKLNTGKKVFDAELRNAINAAVAPPEEED